MVDVIGDNRPSRSDFGTHKFWGDNFGGIGTKVVTSVLTQICQVMLFLGFTDGDVFHLWGDDALFGVVHLGDVFAIDRPSWLVDMPKAQVSSGDVIGTLIAVLA